MRSFNTVFDTQGLKLLAEQFGFNFKEIQEIKSRFDSISADGVLTKELFKESLGLLGLNDYLTEKIFKLIDLDKD